MNFEPNEQVITPLEKTIPNNATCSRPIPTNLLVWILQARNHLNQCCNSIINTSKLKMMQPKCCCSNHFELAATPQEQPNDRLKYNKFDEIRLHSTKSVTKKRARRSQLNNISNPTWTWSYRADYKRRISKQQQSIAQLISFCKV